MYYLTDAISELSKLLLFFIISLLFAVEISSINKTNFRIMLLLISLIMFVVQFRIAMMNLLHPPEVDSTTNMNINDVELPLITVCPTRQENLTNLSFYGYTSRLAILKGSTTYNKTL